MRAGHRAGFVAIVGRPNVGKSTLLNRLVGTKISIVSRRAQTTRHRILGIVSVPDAQMLLVDTPGYQTAHGGALNRLMNRSVIASLQDVDVIVLVVDAGRLTQEDARVVELLPESTPVVLAVNRIDRLKDRAVLLPLIDRARSLYHFSAIVPISAQEGTQLGDLVEAVKQHLPQGPALYETDMLTDRPERFLAAELLREKLFHALGEELPYAATVVIDRFEHEGSLRRIHASIIVDKPGHKSIVIGSRGETLKAMATRARKDMERLFGGKVFLEVWVRVRRGWSDDVRALHSLGYD
ncbi:MAG TPA: GTPase Era [Burkholderiales bacterium]|nr:GTPase Era [Burkholderiales bacterium]